MRQPVFLILLGLGIAAQYALADPLPLPQPSSASTPTLQPIARWAIPGNNGHYEGYYVGGGCSRPRRADGRTVDEGTWGWDYKGWLIPRNIVPGWWHGRRYQGGSGAYKTDG